MIIQFLVFGIASFFLILWGSVIQETSEEIFRNGFFITGILILGVFLVIFILNWRYRWNFLTENIFETVSYRSSTPIPELMRHFRASKEEIYDILYHLINSKRLSGIIENNQFIQSISKINE